MSEQKMRVAVMTATRKISFTERPVPVPGADDVLVRVDCVGICGSDLHYYEEGRIGGFVVEPPFVLGHEASGTVVQVGEHVRQLQVGDRVTMEPGRTCGQCEYCRTGRYNLCPDVAFFATPPVDGVFQEFVVHPAQLCFRLPDTVTSMQGALVEPMAVGFHAAQQADARPGQSAVVFGAGCIGLVTIMALKNRGVMRIYCADIVDNRLAMAERLGAVAVNVGRESIAHRIRDVGVDLAFDTSGAAESVCSAIACVKKGGTVVLIGYSREDAMRLPTNLMIDKELRLQTIFRYRHMYPGIIDAIAAGALHPENIVTNQFLFEQIPEAMEKCVEQKRDIVKAVIHFDGKL